MKNLTLGSTDTLLRWPSWFVLISALLGCASGIDASSPPVPKTQVISPRNLHDQTAASAARLSADPAINIENAAGDPIAFITALARLGRSIPSDKSLIRYMIGEPLIERPVEAKPNSRVRGNAGGFIYGADRIVRVYNYTYDLLDDDTYVADIYFSIGARDHCIPMRDFEVVFGTPTSDDRVVGPHVPRGTRRWVFQQQGATLNAFFRDDCLSTVSLYVRRKNEGKL